MDSGLAWFLVEILNFRSVILSTVYKRIKKVTVSNHTSSSVVRKKRLEIEGGERDRGKGIPIFKDGPSFRMCLCHELYAVGLKIKQSCSCESLSSSSQSVLKTGTSADISRKGHWNAASSKKPRTLSKSASFPNLMDSPLDEKDAWNALEFPIISTHVSQGPALHRIRSSTGLRPDPSKLPKAKRNHLHGEKGEGRSRVLAEARGSLMIIPRAPGDSASPRLIRDATSLRLEPNICFSPSHFLLFPHLKHLLQLPVVSAAH